jgi:hypothetical protein
MENSSYQIFDGKIVIRLRDRICDNAEELFSSEIFIRILNQAILDLSRRNSKLLGIFEHSDISEKDIQLLVDTLNYLTRLQALQAQKLVEGSEQFFRDKNLLNDFVEYLYNYWRQLQRLIVCDSEGDRFDKKPYRTFNSTIERLTHLIRSTYRDIQENITGNHPRIYRQVRAGAEMAAIALPKKINYPNHVYSKLHQVSMIRQALIYPPLIFNTPTNKRTGTFERIYRNPLNNLTLNKQEWLCYPAKVGPLLIMVYFSLSFFELCFSLCNLFELAGDDDLQRSPDAILLFGVPEDCIDGLGKSQTVFYDDEENDILIGAIPDSKQFGYFGYIKKMMLTLHNIKMMKLGRMPYHGAMFHISIRDAGECTFLLMGDTGAGKSETLEALRTLGENAVDDITIIADDMGSLGIDESRNVLGYGTETGAFVRLDDLQPGYAFGQIDRTIIMNPNQTNARVVIPVTTYETVSRGFKVDFVLYANNYECVDESHPVVEQFESPDEALTVFRNGAVMSKGTTSTTGLVNTYFANVFGPVQYPELYDRLAQEYFDTFFRNKVFVGQLRTQLGVPGQEHTGPELAARELLATLKRASAKRTKGK